MFEGMNHREHAIRGTFSFVAAAAFLTVAAENVEYALTSHRHYDRFFIAGAAAAFACWEAIKVLVHIEELLGIDGHKH